MELKSSDEADCLSNTPRKRRKSQEENVVSEVFNDYCSSTSIHGMGYLGAKDKSLPEKIWWVFVIVLSVISCSYLITKMWIKWKNNPVILSFEQEQTAIWEIPFPAVTLCPVSKINQKEYNYTKNFRNRNNLNGEEYNEFWDISLMCNLEQYETAFNCTLNFTDEAAIGYIRNAVWEMGMLILLIKWQGYEYELEHDLFTEQLTEEGVCFTFNSFSQEDMYTKELDHDIVYINHTIQNVGFKLEEGYPSDLNIMDAHPRRTAKDGSGSGLSITLADYPLAADLVCGSPISGYKLILHNPAETPRPKQHYYLFPMNRQVTFSVKPELTTTSEYLRHLSKSERKCYFSNEKLLRFFKVYTQSNCIMECTVNVTQHLCGCASFYMPRDKNTPICGFGKTECVIETEGKMFEFELLENGMNASSEIRETEAFKIYDKCDCLPSCSDLQFTAETSQTESHFFQSILASGLGNEEIKSTVDKLSKGLVRITTVDIFFKQSQFLALHRSELYGSTDFLANSGGLLGLFMGFSLLSLLEIFYFATIRVFVKYRNKRRTQL